jgi:hypothetical protein
MYQMMYRTKGMGATHMDLCKTESEKEEFLKHRELLAKGMDFYTKREGDTLILYTNEDEFGRYYVSDGTQ